VCPLLTKDGPVDEKKFPVASVLDTLQKRRPELQYRTIDATDSRFIHTVSTADRNLFFSMLFDGRMLTSGSFDTVWQALACDYLLVCNLRHGMAVTTFNRVTKKTVLIEAELWDCRSFEVVWRTTVDGSCTNKTLSDGRLIAAGFGEIAAALPALLPSYDNSSW